MEAIKFKTHLSEEVVLLEDVLRRTLDNTFLFEEVSNNQIEIIKNKVISDSKLEKKVIDILTKQYKGSEFENKVTEIAKNCIIQLFKQLWIKRNSWSVGISNKSN